MPWPGTPPGRRTYICCAPGCTPHAPRWTPQCSTHHSCCRYLQMTQMSYIRFSMQHSGKTHLGQHCRGQQAEPRTKEVVEMGLIGSCTGPNFGSPLWPIATLQQGREGSLHVVQRRGVCQLLSGGPLQVRFAYSKTSARTILASRWTRSLEIRMFVPPSRRRRQQPGHCCLPQKPAYVTMK